MSILIQNILKYFPIMIAAYFFFQVIVRLLTTNTAVLDESEQIMLSQYFAWGYNAQPPLYTWLQIGFFKIFGITIIGLSLLKNSLLFVTYFFVYKIGMLVSQDKLKSVLGSLSLILIPQISWESQVDQTHTVLLTTATVCTFFFYSQIILKKSQIITFLFLGLSAAIGLLAKYNFVLVLIGLLGTALIVPAFRKNFFQKKLWVSIIIIFAAVLPHSIWFMTHFDLATSSTVERMNVLQSGEKVKDISQGLSNLFISILAFIFPSSIFFLFFFRKNIYLNKNIGSKIILWFTVIVFTCLVLMILATGITNVKERWLQPFLILFPMLLFLQTRVLVDDKVVKNYMFFCLFIAFLLNLAIFIKPMTIDLKNRQSRDNYPFEEISSTIKSSSMNKSDLLIYAGDKFIGGNIKMNFPELNVITSSLPLQPYEMEKNVLLLYGNNIPNFILELKKRGYTCNDGIFEKPFKYSRKFIYSLNYSYCFCDSKEPKN